MRKKEQAVPLVGIGSQKPEDERLIGKPGEIKVTYNKLGERIDTKIGEDGRAVKERHYTTRPNPKYHTNPHDHQINWNSPRPGIPNYSKAINYPNGAPEFKMYQQKQRRIKEMITNENDRFQTISEFKWSIQQGREVTFLFHGKEYGIVKMDENQFIISEIENNENEMCFHSVDDLLDYLIEEIPLRKLITTVDIIYRTL